MGGFRDETMIRIRKDYIDHGMDSVLAQHLLTEKQEAARSLGDAGKQTGHLAVKKERHDLLAEFLWTREQWAKKGDDWYAGEVLAFIDLLQGDSRYALIYTRTGISSKTKQRLSDDELEEREAINLKKQQKGAACRELLELRGRKKKPTRELLEQATKEITFCLIERAAAERLYNLGYPISGKTASNRTRTKNTVLDLIDAWYSEHAAGGSTAMQSGAEMFDSEPYQELYDYLYKNENMRNVLIPVRIDPQTGMGIYIVGRNQYANADKSLRFPYKDRYCGIEIFGYWESMADWNADTDHGVDLTLGEPESGEIHGFPNVKEANSWFVNLICRDADRFASFRYWNGSMPNVPKALIKLFSRYFEGGADCFIATEEELDETRAEFA